ncbi:bifunctional hydroxymethylpyrimidine kinase/phosphomethylpyrimidine kinase [Candidatus Woesearchaeota archaeon]|nr:bifunctional hydroxymethylpyrimidine kinase/phosphomethylpyrimidine kinase [Candidatus Woesearchaeota archaeon]
MAKFKALTIAGSDSGGGAGIQADLKTFAALGVWGSSVIVAITAQNTIEVTAVHNIPESVITAQIDAVMSDIGADAVKIGMLSNKAIIECVAASITKHKMKKVVLDPVMVAASGAKLLEDSAIESLKNELFGLSMIITPNIPEAEVITGVKIPDSKGMKEAARKIAAYGSKAVLIKGGHLSGDVVDILYIDGRFIEFKNKRIKKEGHGTGCTLSSAISAYLAKGEDIENAVSKAISFVHSALEAGFKVGEKNYVLNHFWKCS